MRPNWRSLLFVSADDPTRLAKVAGRGADAVILDLEDAVSAARKPAARQALPDAVDRLAALGQPLVVRVNTGWLDLVADLEACVRPGVVAVMVPGASEGWRLAALAELLDELEAARDLPAGAIGVIALVESAAGLANLQALAAAPRVIGLALGSEDLSLEVAVPPSAALLDLPSRQIALAAAGAGLMALAVPISISEYADMDAYRAAAATARAYGVTGAICIHPRQVEVANVEFQPSEAEVAEARAVLEAWDARGQGGIASLNGRMIDLPVAERAKRLVARLR
jgi:citrate lyase subunit beta/citryl-CoA lyase